MEHEVISKSVVAYKYLEESQYLNWIANVVEKSHDDCINILNGFLRDNGDAAATAAMALSELAPLGEKLVKEGTMKMEARLKCTALSYVCAAYTLAIIDPHYSNVQETYFSKLTPANPHRLEMWTTFHDIIGKAVTDAADPKIAIKANPEAGPGKSMFVRDYTEEQQAFLEDLKKFDVHYSYSDDLQVYRAGKAQETALEARAKNLDLVNEWEARFER